MWGEIVLGYFIFLLVATVVLAILNEYENCKWWKEQRKREREQRDSRPT